MSSPYDYPEPEQERKPPAITVITVLAVAFALFVVYQVDVNLGQAQEELEAQLEQRTIHEGDRISYHYTVYLPDGTLYQTTDTELAEAEDPDGARGILQSAREAVVNSTDPGLGWGPGADEAVIGTQIGKTVTFTVPVEHAVGPWAPWPPNQGAILRTVFPQDFQRVVFLQEVEAAQQEGNQGSIDFDFDQVDAAIDNLEIGETFNPGREFPPSWDLEFLDVNRDNRSITFRNVVEDGQYFDVPQLPGGVTVLLHDDETWVNYRLDLHEGGTFVVRPQDDFHNANLPTGSFFVDNVTDDRVSLLHNPGSNPAAVGQPLTVHFTPIEKIGGGQGAGMAANQAQRDDPEHQN